MKSFGKYPVLMAGLLIATITPTHRFASSASNNTIWLAQAPLAAKIPTAGTVLGWELNMNRVYSQQLERNLYNQPKNVDDAPVIFFNNIQNQPDNNNTQFLLNTPKQGQ